jgi:hypothetical protein
MQVEILLSKPTYTIPTDVSKIGLIIALSLKEIIKSLYGRDSTITVSFDLKDDKRITLKFHSTDLEKEKFEKASNVFLEYLELKKKLLSGEFKNFKIHL